MDFPKTAVTCSNIFHSSIWLLPWRVWAASLVKFNMCWYCYCERWFLPTVCFSTFCMVASLTSLVFSLCVRNMEEGSTNFSLPVLLFLFFNANISSGAQIPLLGQRLDYRSLSWGNCGWALSGELCLSSFSWWIPTPCLCTIVSTLDLNDERTLKNKPCTDLQSSTLSTHVCWLYIYAD